MTLFRQSFNLTVAAAPCTTSCTAPHECHRFSHCEFRPHRAHCVELPTDAPDILSRYPLDSADIGMIAIPGSTGEINDLLGQERVLSVSGGYAVPAVGELTSCPVFCWMETSRI